MLPPLLLSARCEVSYCQDYDKSHICGFQFSLNVLPPSYQIRQIGEGGFQLRLGGQEGHLVLGHVLLLGHLPPLIV